MPVTPEPRPRVPSWVLATGFALLYLWLDPRTADLAAQSYRAGLFARDGFVLWDNGWYGGHHVPAYSLLFPPLGGVLGARVVGALSAVAGAWAFQRLIGREARLAGAWGALGMASLLVTNRLTFALGVALGLGALAATREGRRTAAVLLAALSSAASPVAGAFVLLALAAWWIGEPAARRRSTVAIGVASLAPAAVASLLFPEGGTFPFALSSFAPALAASLLVLVLLPREQRTLRAGVALSVLLLVLSWALPTPMGGNAVRLGALFAGPVLALTLDRRRTLLLVAPALLYWQLAAPIDDWRRTGHDRSIEERAYTGFEAFLARQDGTPFRVEVPFTDNHWESANLAGGHDGFPLARGWERQYDRKVNALFYDGKPLTAARYRAWLDANAVRFVALANAPIDYSAAAEAKLVRGGLPYLRPVYGDAGWRVWEVRGAAPMGVTQLPADGFTTARAGRVRIRWSPYFQVVAGRGCVRRTADGRTAVTGAVRVQARFSVRGALRATQQCAS